MRERDVLKTILHRTYGKVMAMRVTLRITMKSFFHAAIQVRRRRRLYLYLYLYLYLSMCVLVCVCVCVCVC